MIGRGHDRCDNPCPCSSGNEVVPGSWMDTRTPADGVVTPIYSSLKFKIDKIYILERNAYESFSYE